MKLKKIIESSNCDDFDWSCLPVGPIKFLVLNGHIVDCAKLVFSPELEKELFYEVQRKSYDEDLICSFDPDRFIFWDIAYSKLNQMNLYLMLDTKTKKVYYLSRANNFYLIDQNKMLKWFFN